MHGCLSHRKQGHPKIAPPRIAARRWIFFLLLPLLCACGSGGGSGGSTETTATTVSHPLVSFSDAWPDAGTTGSTCAVPADALPEDTTLPDQVVGDGTPQSCTSDAFVDAVAAGGVMIVVLNPVVQQFDKLF